jgi:hypothetical protein
VIVISLNGFAKSSQMVINGWFVCFLWHRLQKKKKRQGTYITGGKKRSAPLSAYTETSSAPSLYTSPCYVNRQSQPNMPTSRSVQEHIQPSVPLARITSDKLSVKTNGESPFRGRTFSLFMWIVIGLQAKLFRSQCSVCRTRDH